VIASNGLSKSIACGSTTGSTPLGRPVVPDE
jgi:hypothetical protein